MPEWFQICGEVLVLDEQGGPTGEESTRWPLSGFVTRSGSTAWGMGRSRH